MTPEAPIFRQRPVDRLQPYEQKYGCSCGPASLLVAYRALGIETYNEERLIREADVGMNGCDWQELMIHVMDKAHLGLTFRASATWQELKYCYDMRGNPILVCWQTDRYEGKVANDFTHSIDKHFSVVSDITDKDITLVDVGSGDLFSMPKDYFMQRWYEEDRERCFMEVRPR
jgi:predicted double-glycine peptidase